MRCRVSLWLLLSVWLAAVPVSAQQEACPPDPESACPPDPNVGCCCIVLEGCLVCFPTALGSPCPPEPPPPPPPPPEDGQEEKRFAVFVETIPTGGIPPFTDCRLVPDELETPFVLNLGEHFKVEVFEVGGTDCKATKGEEVPVETVMLEMPQAVNAPPIQSEFFSQPAVLFPDNVLIQFTSTPEQFFPVHSGTAQVAITFQAEGANQQATVSVQTTSCPSGATDCFTLGNTKNRFDNDMIRFADLRGIPPQIVKGHVDREASNEEIDGRREYVADSYRYEPLTVDFANFSTGFIRNPLVQTNLRSDRRFEAFRLESFPDSEEENGLPQGSGFAALAEEDKDKLLKLREKFNVLLVDGQPLRDFLSPESTITGNLVLRRAESSDPPISMENILTQNEEQQHWAFGLDQQGNFTIPLPSFRTYIRYRQIGDPTRGIPAGSPFTGQTVLAGSYGLMQMLYVTAVDLLGFTDDEDVGRPPSLLFRPTTVLDLGTEFVTQEFRSEFSEPAQTPNFRDLDDFNQKMANSLQQYNPNMRGYGPNIIERSRSFFPGR